MLDQASQKEIDNSLYSIEVVGQTIRFQYYGTLRKRLQVNYWVDIPSGSNVAKYTNTATITYTQGGEPHQEHRNYVLRGMNNSAANGEKSVDKSIISTDPEDQYVIYTIKFWNSNGFSAGIRPRLRNMTAGLGAFHWQFIKSPLWMIPKMELPIRQISRESLQPRRS